LLLVHGVLIVEESWIVALSLHVLLWRLVLLIQLHLPQLFRKFSVLLVLGCLFLHSDLGTAELLEDVLVVQDRVCEFIFKLRPL
jgi:hypothetical protein